MSADTIKRVRVGAAVASFGCAMAATPERVDPFRQAEVEIGQATLAVGGKDQADLVIANIDVGMMLLVLGHFGDAVDEIDRFGELVEFESPLDMLLLELPLRDLFRRFFSSSALISSAITATRVTLRFAFAMANPSGFFGPISPG